MSNVAEVPFLDLTRRSEGDWSELEETCSRVLRSGRYVLGSEVRELEAECASYLQTKHAVGVSSGTDALLVTLMALGVGPGDEVICPTYSFFATAGAIWRTGAKPVFADVLPETFNVDPEGIGRAITERTRAIIPVHLFGRCADTTAIGEVASARGIPVIEDAAQAIGSEHRGRRAGGLGTAACFSFYPSKNLGGFGDAGLVTTNDDELADRIRVLRVQGGEPKYVHAAVGGNFRIDALQAALLRVQLKRLDDWTARRRRNAAAYDRELADSGATGAGVTVPAADGDRHVYHQYVIRQSDGRRDQLRAHLADRRIGTEIYYPVPLHLQQCFASLGGREGDHPVAETLAKESLALPIFPTLTREEIAYVAGSVAEFTRAASRPPRSS